jgi:hypothetical protein
MQTSIPSDWDRIERIRAARRKLAERLAPHLDADFPSGVVEAPETAIEDGGGYGGDLDPRPDFVKADEAAWWGGRPPPPPFHRMERGVRGEVLRAHDLRRALQAGRNKPRPYVGLCSAPRRR